MENIIEKDESYTIYKHTNKINGKCYIGITSQKPKERWGNNGNNYLKKTKKGTYYQPKFAHALLKYSWDDFEHEILFNNLTSDEAKQKEFELIAYYDSINNGYNIEIGGNYTVCAIEKPVKQYTKEGLFVREYDSVKQASEIINVNNRSISACCRNKLKTAGDYIWRFSSDELTNEYLTWCNSNDMGNNRLGVCQYSLNGIFIKKYDSATSAGVAMGAKNGSHISMCCQGKEKIAYGCIWRYEWEELTQEHLEWCNFKDNFKRKKVSQYLKDGTFVEIYESVTEASLRTGVHQNGIAMCCRGEIKTAGNYLWRYASDIQDPTAPLFPTTSPTLSETI